MKLGAWLFAATLPVLAAMLVLSLAGRRDESAEPAEQGATIDAQGAATDEPRAATDERPAWIREPPPFVFEPDLTLPAINDASRELNASLNRSIRDRIAADVDAELARLFGRNREENAILPALPGVAGFDVAICPRSMNCLNARLLEEADNPNWARPMEARIFDTLARSTPGGLAQVDVVCRETICGVLLPSSPGAVQPNLNDAARLLRSELGFSAHYQMTQQPELQAIYLSTELPEWWPRVFGDE